MNDLERKLESIKRRKQAIDRLFHFGQTGHWVGFGVWLGSVFLGNLASEFAGVAMMASGVLLMWLAVRRLKKLNKEF